MSESQILGDYELWLRSWTSSETTVRARVRLAQSRMREWGPVDGWTPVQVQTWIGRPDLKGWSRATYFSNLKSFCEWATLAGLIVNDPMEGLKKQPRPRSLPRPLTEDEVARVMAAAKGNVRAWQLLALLAGLRAHEIAKIRGEDIDERSLYVLGKGAKAATLPTHPDLWALAQEYPRRGYWFPGKRAAPHIAATSVTRLTSLLYDDLHIDGSIHRMRHVYGTRLLRTGTNIRKVQRLMRHESLETTAVYTAVDEDELRAAINLLSA